MSRVGFAETSPVVACLLLLVNCTPAGGGLPTCYNASAALTKDYGHIVGAVDFNDPNGDVQMYSGYQWIVNEVPSSFGQVQELLAIHFDGSTAGSAGEAANQAAQVSYAIGKWGSALKLEDNGLLKYTRRGNLRLDEGTVRMWVSLREDGSAPIYGSRSHILFHYSAPNGDYVWIAQSGGSGVLYAGGVVNGQWQSAYSNRANMRSWPAGQWHNIVYTFSVSENFMRFYLDGVLLAENNEGHYWMPSAASNEFSVGGALWWEASYYLLDEVRILGRAAGSQEIASWARRRQQPRANEVWLDTNGLDPNDQVRFEFTPSDGNTSVTPCVSDVIVYPGIPIFEPNPPSTLLAPGMTAVTLSVKTVAATGCRYSVNTLLDYNDTIPFDSGAGTTEHETLVSGLNAEPNVVNSIYLRCGAYPDFVLRLKYRCLGQVNPPFPRTGNLWGLGDFYNKGLEYCARIDLWLGAWFNAGDIKELRRLNPDILVLTSMNAVENQNLPEDYYLHDANGNRVETWPGAYRLNLTKDYVAQYQAEFAAQRILDSNLAFDGCFFDNVMTTQSWQDYDIYGNAFHPDADEDGIPDDPAVFDAAWKAGVFHELAEFRKLMPYALTTGHAMNIFEPNIGETFNGISIGFWTADVLEGKRNLGEFLDMYNAWHDDALSPHITMMESSPHDQIAYGYDYSPWEKISASTLEFARTYYPYVRFGLAFTLMNDGYFAHEYGDTWHGNDWWYDELDFDLGYPLGCAELIDVTDSPPENMLPNHSFEQSGLWPWSFWANSGQGCVAALSRDTTTAAHGSACARVDITATSGTDWHIELRQTDVSLTGGTSYELTFWAKADVNRAISLDARKQSADWDWYGLDKTIDIDTDWTRYCATFTANADTNESRIQFHFGESTGTVWIDDVNLHESPPRVLQRRFTNGLVLLNTSDEYQTIDVGPGHRRITGEQAPLHEYIIDDSDEAFVADAEFNEVTYDSGEWQAVGPFYHDWQGFCHESSTAGAAARWNLHIPEPDTYTITAWYPAAPEANGWTQAALFEIVDDANSVLAAATLDQTQDGDQWHLIGEVNVAPADNAFVRLTCTEAKPTIADALHIRSSNRYNNGLPAASVTLQPMDGIILEWTAARGDFDADGDVDLIDYAILAGVWLAKSPLPAFDIAPMPPDNRIDLLDMAELADNWLRTIGQ